MSFVCSFFWGVSENFLQTNTSALVSKIFPGKVEAFSAFRVFFSLGVVLILLLNVALSEVTGYIFVSIVLGLQVLITGVSMNLKDLDNIEIS